MRAGAYSERRTQPAAAPSTGAALSAGIARRERGDCRALAVLAGFAEIRVPDRAGPAWPHAGELAAQAHGRRAALALSGGSPGQGRGPGRARAAADRRARLRAVLPYRA